jgi:hypothetical protein
VVGLVGSINASYCIQESLWLFKLIFEENPNAHLLCLTRQIYEMKDLIQTHQLAANTYTLATVPHEQIADWLRYMDWALLLLNIRFSKRGSMPTKLAEFFSCGVRPIQYGCNVEVSKRVLEAGSGIVLESLGISDLSKAAKVVAKAALEENRIIAAREITRPFFSLESGISKYAQLFAGLLPQDDNMDVLVRVERIQSKQ